MNENLQDYDTGEWLMHTHFGAGQVLGTETKHVSGEEKTYYKIETANSTLWMPVDGLDESKIRPLSLSNDFQIAIHELTSPPEEMDPNVNERKKRIADVKSANIPQLTARLVRDLWDKQREAGTLYDWEREAWRSLSSRLVQEWALCEEISAEEARHRLNQLLADRFIEDPDEKVKVHKSLISTLADENKKWSNWMKKAVNQNQKANTE
jgi:RNA polymerase-interacting CarD/CdnL/TRCF family regulator